jgi:uncharacterized protein GlcG (DUF336 family)
MLKAFRNLTIAALVAGTPLHAQDDSAFVEFQVLKPEIAQEMAVAAMEHCRSLGYQVGVMVVDRFGAPQVFVRDQYAGLHVFETAHRKAWTSASFRTPTGELSEVSQAGEDLFGLRALSKALPLGGGLPVLEGSGSLVAGIGVSGAPGGALDEECAQAGIDRIEDYIAF